MRKIKPPPGTSPPQSVCCEDTCLLPVLATAEQIAKPLGVTSRTITAWAASRKIPVALRHGKILRFYAPAVAAALGLDVPGFGDRPPVAVSLAHKY